MKKIYILIVKFLYTSIVFAQSIITPTTTNVSCNGGMDGSTSLTVTGGTPPYSYAWIPTGQTTGNISNLTAGTYSVTVTDALSIMTTATITITEPPPLNIILTSISPSDSVSCDGSASASVSGGTSPYTYMWLSGGETTVTINGKCEGSYGFHVTDSNGCTKSDTTHLIGTTTNIESQSLVSNTLSVFPSPCTSTFNIHLPNQQSFLLSVTDITGKKVYKNKNATGKITIDANSFSSGVYFVKAVNERTVLTVKMVKE